MATPHDKDLTALFPLELDSIEGGTDFNFADPTRLPANFECPEGWAPRWCNPGNVERYKTELKARTWPDQAAVNALNPRQVLMLIHRDVIKARRKRLDEQNNQAIRAAKAQVKETAGAAFFQQPEDTDKL